MTSTLPFGFSQLMCRTDSVSGLPTAAVVELATGCSRDRTTELAQVMAPKAFSRLPVTVAFWLGLGSPPAGIRFLISIQSRAGVSALSRGGGPGARGVGAQV